MIGYLTNRCAFSWVLLIKFSYSALNSLSSILIQRKKFAEYVDRDAGSGFYQV